MPLKDLFFHAWNESLAKPDESVFDVQIGFKEGVNYKEGSGAYFYGIASATAQAGDSVYQTTLKPIAGISSSVFAHFRLAGNNVQAVDSFLREYFQTFIVQYAEKLYFVYQWRHMDPKQKLHFAFEYGIKGSSHAFVSPWIRYLLSGLLYFFVQKGTDTQLVQNAVHRHADTVLPRLPFADVTVIHAVGGDTAFRIKAFDAGDTLTARAKRQVAVTQKALENLQNPSLYQTFDPRQIQTTLPGYAGINSEFGAFAGVVQRQNITDALNAATSGVTIPSYEDSLLAHIASGSIVDAGEQKERREQAAEIQQKQEEDRAQYTPQITNQTSEVLLSLADIRTPWNDKRRYSRYKNTIEPAILQRMGTGDLLVSREQAQAAASFLVLIGGSNYGVSRSFASDMLFGPQGRALTVLADTTLRADENDAERFLIPDTNNPLLASFAAGAPVGVSLLGAKQSQTAVWGDPGLALDIPQTPVRIGYDTQKILKEYTADTKGYMAQVFRNIYPLASQIDWNDEYKIRELFAQTAEKEAALARDGNIAQLVTGAPRTQQDLYQTYGLYSRTMTDRTLGRLMIHSEQTPEYMLNGHFVTGYKQGQDVLLVQPDNRFVLYKYDPTNVSLFTELGEIFRLPETETTFSLTVGNFVGDSVAQSTSAADDILIASSDALYILENKTESDGSHRFVVRTAQTVQKDSERFATVLAFRSEGVDDTETLDDILYSRINGEVGMILNGDFDHPLIVQKGEKTLPPLTLNRVYSDVFTPGMNLQTYEKNPERQPEMYIWYP